MYVTKEIATVLGVTNQFVLKIRKEYSNFLTSTIKKKSYSYTEEDKDKILYINKMLSEGAVKEDIIEGLGNWRLNVKKPLEPIREYVDPLSLMPKETAIKKTTSIPLSKESSRKEIPSSPKKIVNPHRREFFYIGILTAIICCLILRGILYNITTTYRLKSNCVLIIDNDLDGFVKMYSQYKKWLSKEQ